jgi:hypothetical protein
MAASCFGGSERIAQTLTRAGYRIAAETVRRIRKEKATPPPEPLFELPRRRSLRARYPNHVAMSDLTDIPSLFRLFSFKLAAVSTSFPAFLWPLVFFGASLSGPQIAGLFREAAERTDFPSISSPTRGSEFTSEAFRKTILDSSISHRFGALRQDGLHRRNRTVLEDGERPSRPPLFSAAHPRGSPAPSRARALLLRLPSPPSVAPRRHSRRGLLRPRARSPIRPISSRARPREEPSGLPYRIAYLGGERGLPVLLPSEKAA